METPQRKSERLIALAALGVLLFNFPLLALFARPVLVLGIPLIYLYVFVIWVAFIAAVALLLRESAPRTGTEPRSGAR